MIHTNEILKRLQGFKGGVKHFWEKLHNKMERNSSDESEFSQGDNYEFTPDDQVSTSPRTRSPLSDSSADAQDLVWENEDASMQDKSYSFDEVTTNLDYELEDENDSESSRESRYT
jgi:hypothetical protein